MAHGAGELGEVGVASVWAVLTASMIMSAIRVRHARFEGGKWLARARVTFVPDGRAGQQDASDRQVGENLGQR